MRSYIIENILPLACEKVSLDLTMFINRFLIYFLQKGYVFTSSLSEVAAVGNEGSTKYLA
jgi:hypothetical protein